MRILLLLFCSLMLLHRLVRTRRITSSRLAGCRRLLTMHSRMLVPGNDPSLEWDSFTLPGNGIPVILCRDPASVKSSASLAVRVGATSDPSHMAGLAHFTEHAVFLGSQKYPVENTYKDYLSKNGGSSNAATSMETTLYKFEINSHAFRHALDIFSQFFKKPLFNSGAIAREVMAVDSEDSKNRILDGRRSLQVMKDLIVPGHPYKKFSTGNEKTISGGNAVENSAQVSEVMRKFHLTHYRPDKMGICMAGPQALSELRSLATEMFDEIKCFEGDVHGTEATSSGSVTLSDAYPFKEGGLLCRMRPIKDLRSMSVVWSVPSTRALFSNDPTLLLGYLLSHKGRDSLFCQLQSRGLVTSLDASESTQFTDFSLFEITFGLTQRGLEGYPEVLTLMYEHISTVQRADDCQLQAYWTELRDNLFLKFKYQSKSSPYELTQSACKDVLLYGAANALSAGWILDAQPDLHSHRLFARHLSPQRSITTLRAREFERWIPVDGSVSVGDIGSERLPLSEAPNRLEPWYGIPYHLEPIALPACCESVRHALPSANEYISADLVLKLRAAEEREEGEGGNGVTSTSARPLRSAPPRELQRTGGYDICHYSTDEVFMQPKTIVYCLVHAPSVDNLHPVSGLLVSLFDQLTVSKYYSASVAGLQHGLSISSRGISSYVAGFSSAEPDSSKLGRLLLQLLADFTDPQLWAQHLDDEQVGLLANLKERQIRGLRGWRKERPDSQCDSIISYVLSERGFLPAERLRQAEEITPAMAREALRGLRSNIRTLSTYTHGNMASDDAATLHRRIHSSLFADGCEDRSFADECMPRGRLLADASNLRIKIPTFNPEDENSAVVLHVQTEANSPSCSAFLLLLRRFIGEPLFAELRTRKQLGYVVSASTAGFGRGARSVRGLTFSVLSKRFDPDYIMGELEAFLESQKEVFTRLTQEEVTDRANSIALSLEEPPKSYLEEASDYHDSLMSDMPLDWRELVIGELRAMSLDAFRSRAEVLVLDERTRKSVAVMLYGSKAVVDLRARGGETVLASIEEVTALRESLEYY